MGSSDALLSTSFKPLLHGAASGGMPGPVQRALEAVVRQLNQEEVSCPVSSAASAQASSTPARPSANGAAKAPSDWPCQMADQCGVSNETLRGCVLQKSACMPAPSAWPLLPSSSVPQADGSLLALSSASGTQCGHIFIQDGGPESLRPAYARAKVLAAEIAVVQRELDCSSIVYVLGRAHSRLGDKSNWWAALQACCIPFIAGWAVSPTDWGLLYASAVTHVTAASASD